jgi:hypothetical protein
MKSLSKKILSVLIRYFRLVLGQWDNSHNMSQTLLTVRLSQSCVVTDCKYMQLKTCRPITQGGTNRKS